MTNDELYNFLYDWAEQVLDPGKTGTPPIIISHENAPAPKVNHIVIQYNGNRRKIGRVNKTKIDEITETRKHVNDYEVIVDLWESKGGGDLLQSLLDSVELFDILQLFNTNHVSYLGENSPIQSVPRLLNERWVKESLVSIRLMIPSSVEETNAGIIENIEYTGTVGAQGRAGSHTITNT
jgi:hypothetical protein